MASRLKIILLSAIPASAGILYLLWSYAWKRRISRSGEEPARELPSIHINALSDSKTNKERTNELAAEDDQTLVNCSLLKDAHSGSDHGNFSLSDDIDLSSWSRGPSPINGIIDDHFSRPWSPKSESGVTATDVFALTDRLIHSSDVTESSHEVIDAKCRIGDAGTTVITLADLQAVLNAESTCLPNGKTMPDLCLGDFIEPVFIEPVDSGNKLLTKECWSSSCPGITEIGDSINDKENENPILTRKDSIDSTSDGNSRNSSKDRNGNSCRRNNKKNKNVNRRLSQSKDKSVKSHTFDFPTEFCGQLIGRRGHYVSLVKEKSGVEIYIRPKMYNSAWQTVTLEGTQQQVNKALDMIRRRFPAKFYPGIDFNHSVPDLPVVPAELMQLTLPPGVPLEVVVCSVITPNHLFIQQPTHPTFPSLERQAMNMRACYSVDSVPCLPRPIEVGVICAAPFGTNWHRAQIVQSYHDIDEYDLKLVDYGGYVHMAGTLLRQIRSDFMAVPFQAIECYLANVLPLQDEDEFVPEAKTVLEELVKGSILQCMVTAVEADGVPYVELAKFTEKGQQAIDINRELVRRDLARWLEI